MAVSRGVANALAAMKVPTSRLVAIPNPVQYRSTKACVDRPHDAPARYILAVGRLHFQKGFDRLLYAFAGINDPDLFLVILGEGAERNALVELTHSLGIAKRVRLPGAVADTVPWYQHAICFVLSSRYEGWPNVLMEAMSNNCPVVSFNCRYGPSEIIEHGVCGLLVEEGDVDGLQKMITLLLLDIVLKETFSEQGIKRVGEFNISKIAEQWIVAD